ncbi:MAG: hypothetical protein LBU77_03270 [Clostridiales bacterium]|jgi:hypothetical protein|nr:hypothetical protein [Clostridiales bacterium]
MKNENALQDHYQAAIKSCYDYFFRLIPGIESMIHGLRADPADHFESLSDAFEGIYWLALAFIRTSEAHQIVVNTDEIHSAQQAVVASLSAGDYAAVADTLENKTLPMLRGWFDTLNQEYGYEQNNEDQ